MRGQPCHLVGKHLAVVFLLFRAHIAPRCQDMLVFADVVQRGGITEAGDVLVIPIPPQPLPRPQGKGVRFARR